MSGSQPTVSGPPQGAPTVNLDAHVAYVLRHGDDELIIAQRLAEWISRAPELEEDIAVGNMGLDHLGRARLLLDHAGSLEGAGRSEDDLAMFRDERQFTNLLLVEQPNGDFAETAARSLFYDTYQLLLWQELTASSDRLLAGIAAKAVKETRYHVRHWSTWVVRLGDGTEESHGRMQGAVDRLWRFTPEPFLADEIDRAMAGAGIGVDPSTLQSRWSSRIADVFDEAGLTMPEFTTARSGGRQGFHTEHLGHLLAEMQWVQRSHPGLTW